MQKTRLRIRWADLFATLCAAVIMAGFVVAMLANLIEQTTR